MLRLQLHLFSHGFVEDKISWVSSYWGKWVVTSSKHWQTHVIQHLNIHSCFNRSDWNFFAVWSPKETFVLTASDTHGRVFMLLTTLCINLLNARLLSVAQTMNICSCQTLRNPTQQSVAQPILHHNRNKLSFSSSGWCKRFYQESFPLKEQNNVKYINVLLLP